MGEFVPQTLSYIRLGLGFAVIFWPLVIGGLIIEWEHGICRKILRWRNKTNA